ncbi:MAG: hypothetical protein CL413_09125 [Acidimicrobiaceae bacterium]|nr:hypothetical protein [Acidimicrobiaceae bacterium]
MMPRSLLALLMSFALLVAACGNNDSADADGVPAGSGDASDSAADTEPEETVPPTTDTIPAEAMELPDLQMVFVEFGDDGYVEIANVGDTDADVGGVQLCQSATCVDIGPIAAGTIPAGTSILVMASMLGGLAVDGGEAALHSGTDVTNPDTIFGFVQWGSGGVRADVAAEAGIWPAGASVEPDPAFNSIELFGDPADPENWS